METLKIQLHFLTLISMKGLFLFCILATASVHGAMHSINRHYEVWCTGNCDSDVVSNATSPGVVLMGGGVSQNVLILVCFTL